MPLFFKAKIRKKVVFALSFTFTFKHAKVPIIGEMYLECRLALRECPLGCWDGYLVPNRGSYHLHFADTETKECFLVCY